MNSYDAIIIGSGQAGTPLAFKLAEKGRTVAIIEKEHYGGTCLNTGCTPTKAYVASARRMFDAHNGEALGIAIPAGAKAQLSKIKARKDSLINKSVAGIKDGLEKNDKIATYFGKAIFTGHKEVEVAGEKLKGKDIYINVGGRPREPKEYDDVGALNNQSILELTELPEHLVIVGGSYIGLEFGQIFQRFGSKVTIVEMKDRIISKEDADVSSAIHETLEKEGMAFRLKATCLGAKRLDDGRVEVNVDCEVGEPVVHGSHLLLAIGRVPNTDDLG
ncbi:MAG: FAD-dependent oxidoreductase, partial [Flavobacteriaceae bacterium]|nr:FAD-dependent oxidoreductase [Flavobacteriaceae bacterium]